MEKCSQNNFFTGKCKTIEGKFFSLKRIHKEMLRFFLRRIKLIIEILFFHIDSIKFSLSFIERKSSLVEENNEYKCFYSIIYKKARILLNKKNQLLHLKINRMN